MNIGTSTFPRECIPCSIIIDMITKTPQTMATAHVGVSCSDLSSEPPAIKISNCGKSRNQGIST